ncbi:hypothetical protein [Streptomyces radiopugnans]|nr:hypothetical protein [Streptomyces radiopugnans]
MHPLQAIWREESMMTAASGVSSSGTLLMMWWAWSMALPKMGKICAARP